MTPDEAVTITRLGLQGCCVPCVGNLFTSLAQEMPEREWLGLIAGLDPDSEVLDYIRNPEEYAE